MIPNTNNNQLLSFCSKYEGSILIYFSKHLGSLNYVSLLSSLCNLNKENLNEFITIFENFQILIELNDRNELNSLNKDQNYINNANDNIKYILKLNEFLLNNNDYNGIYAKILSSDKLKLRENLFYLHLISYIRFYQLEICKKENYDLKDVFITKKIENFVCKNFVLPKFSFSITRNFNNFDYNKFISKNNLNNIVENYLNLNEDKEIISKSVNKTDCIDNNSEKIIHNNNNKEKDKNKVNFKTAITNQVMTILKKNIIKKELIDISKSKNFKDTFIYNMTSLFDLIRDFNFNFKNINCFLYSELLEKINLFFKYLNKSKNIIIYY